MTCEQCGADFPAATDVRLFCDAGDHIDVAVCCPCCAAVYSTSLDPEGTLTLGHHPDLQPQT